MENRAVQVSSGCWILSRRLCPVHVELGLSWSWRPRAPGDRVLEQSIRVELHGPGTLGSLGEIPGKGLSPDLPSLRLPLLQD